MICQLLPKIYGFNKSSEAGPDAFAPSVFLRNCQLRCPYCMNSRLVTGENIKPDISLDEVKLFVKENDCKWVGISGGEPLYRSIFEIMSMVYEIKKWGCKIALSTNGLEFNKLSMILSFVDYVTLDIKTDKDRYDNLLAGKTGNKTKLGLFDSVFTSLGKLRAKKHFHDSFNYEIRTTLYPSLVDEKAIRYIGMALQKEEKWILQPFRKTKTMLSKKAKNIPLYDDIEIKYLASVAMEYTNEVKVREV